PNDNLNELWAVFDLVYSPGNPPLDPDYTSVPDGSGTRDYYAIHEILHTLGIDHLKDHALNADDLVSDHARYTVTSNNKAIERNSGHAVTPMALDVAALHHLYGGKEKA